MCSKLFLLFACAVLATASARVTRDVAAEPSFSDFFENAGKSLKQLEEVLMKSLGVENAEQLQEKAVDQGKQFANKLDEWANTIKQETETLKDNAAVKELRSTVDLAIKDFEQKLPNTTADIKSYVEKANKGTEDVVAKLKSLGESEEAKNIKELSVKLLAEAEKTFKNIATDIQESSAKKE